MELINREDTIKRIKRLVFREVDWGDCDLYDKAFDNNDDYLLAILDAIDVVEDMLTVAPTGIDGDSVIEHAEVNGESRAFIKKLTDYIEDADEVEPKQGEWKITNTYKDHNGRVVDRVEHTDCGYIWHREMGKPLHNFCPNCGADMRKGADDE